MVFVAEQQPEVSLRVAEDFSAAQIADVRIGYQVRYFDPQELVGAGFTQPEPVAQGGDPETVGVVAAERDDGLVLEGGGQVLVVVEAVTVVVTGGVALVDGAEPEVLVAVAVDGADLGSGNLEGKARVILEQDAVDVALPAEHAFSDDIEQQGVVVDREEDVHVSAHDARLAAYGFGKLFPRAGTGIIDAQVAYARQPELAVAGMADVVGVEGEGNGFQDGEVAAVISLEYSQVFQDIKAVSNPVLRREPVCVVIGNDDVEFFFFRRPGCSSPCNLPSGYGRPEPLRCAGNCRILPHRECVGMPRFPCGRRRRRPSPPKAVRPGRRKRR